MNSSTRRSGLGRGLAALIPDTVMDTSPSPSRGQPGSTVRKVPLSDIRPNPEQPRLAFDKAALDELASSIRFMDLMVKS